MPKFIDLTNQTFGRLTVIQRVDSDKRTRIARTMWECLCICGTTIITRATGLKSGHTTSCGCFQKEQVSKHSTTHGLSKTSFYNAWRNMRKRCYDVNHKAYVDYGARGIRVAKRWHIFDNFMSDMFASYQVHVSLYGQRNTTLNRVDNDGNYQPSNCEWATHKVQARNKRPRKK